MTAAYWVSLGTCVALLVFLFMLLRGRRLREKYAAAWILLALLVCVVGAFPDLVFWLAARLGVVTPANLLFSAALIVLLLVCLQLSAELTDNEEEIRTLTEEVAILKLQVSEIIADSRTTGSSAVDSSAVDSSAVDSSAVEWKTTRTSDQRDSGPSAS